MTTLIQCIIGLAVGMLVILLQESINQHLLIGIVTAVAVSSLCWLYELSIKHNHLVDWTKQLCILHIQLVELVKKLLKGKSEDS